VAEEQISTNLHIEFDSAAAFESIIEKITVKVPKSSEGIHTPSEVVKVARTCLIDVFKTIVEAMHEEEIQKHLESLFIVKSGLSKMINKNLLN